MKARPVTSAEVADVVDAETRSGGTIGQGLLAGERMDVIDQVTLHAAGPRGTDGGLGEPGLFASACHGLTVYANSKPGPRI